MSVEICLCRNKNVTIICYKVFVAIICCDCIGELRSYVTKYMLQSIGCDCIGRLP